MVKKIRKGFTIVELIIVIAVMAVLAAVLIPTFVHLSKKAKQTSDKSLVTNLNTALAMEESEIGRKPSTMHDAVKGLYNQGFVLENLVTKSDDDLVYHLSENKFYLSSDVDSPNKSEYWHIYSSQPETQTWSIYATGSWVNVDNLTVGFDAGYVEGIETINFVGGNDVIIRTNGGDLVINAPSNTVRHFGLANVVDIQKVAPTSYSEYGDAAFIKVKTGRVVVTKDANIGGIHAVATVDSGDKYFDNIKIAVVGDAEVPTITRDPASVDEKVSDGNYSQYVLEVQTLSSEADTDEAPEYVWANVTVEGETKTNNTAVSSVAMTEEQKSSKEVKNTTTAGSQGTSVIANNIADATKESKNESEAAEAASEIITPVFGSDMFIRAGVKGYKTVADLNAAVAAYSGDKMNLVVLKDFAVNAVIDLNHSGLEVILDLNGYTLSRSTNVIKVQSNTNLRIKDSSESHTGSIITTGSSYPIYIYGSNVELSIEGGTIVNTANSQPAVYLGIEANSVTITVKGDDTLLKGKNAIKSGSSNSNLSIDLQGGKFEGYASSASDGTLNVPTNAGLTLKIGKCIIVNTYNNVNAQAIYARNASITISGATISSKKLINTATGANENTISIGECELNCVMGNDPQSYVVGFTEEQEYTEANNYTIHVGDYIIIRSETSNTLWPYHYQIISAN